MEVQILSTKMIKPSAPTPPHLRTLKLTLIDQFFFVKVPLLFYYPADSSAGIEQVQKHKDRLQKSLSEILTRYYPLAGRYVKDGNYVDCNDEGAEYLEAKVEGRLSEFLSRRDELIPHLHQLAGGRFTSPLVSVQVNTFDCGGLVVGVRTSHRFCDGFSSCNFLLSWATASKHGINEVISPFFEVSSFLPENDLPMPRPPPARVISDDPTVTRRFVLDGAIISALKARAYDPSFPRQATRVEVVSAMIWRALIGVSRAKHGRLRPSLANHPLNLRSNIVPPLPPMCIGNLCPAVSTKFVPDNGNIDVPDLKDLVGLLVDTFAKSKHTLVAREDVLSTIVKINSEINEFAELNEEVEVHNTASWCRFPLYDADFGWGKPIWVSNVNSPREATLLMDTDGGDGIEVWVILKEEDMPLFLEDEDILALASKQVP